MIEPNETMLSKAQASYQKFIRSSRRRKPVDYHPADHDAHRLLTREQRLYPAFQRKFNDRF